MSKETKLDHCPFCGGEAIKFQDWAMAIESGMKCTRTFVVCSQCDAVMSGATEEEAVAAWNRRVGKGEAKEGAKDEQAKPAD